MFTLLTSSIGNTLFSIVYVNNRLTIMSVPITKSYYNNNRNLWYQAIIMINHLLSYFPSIFTLSFLCLSSNFKFTALLHPSTYRYTFLPVCILNILSLATEFLNFIQIWTFTICNPMSFDIVCLQHNSYPFFTIY